MRYSTMGRDLLVALSLVAVLAGAGCAGCRDEPEQAVAPAPAPEPSRQDRLLDGLTNRAIDEIENREAPSR